MRSKARAENIVVGEEGNRVTEKIDGVFFPYHILGSEIWTFICVIL